VNWVVSLNSRSTQPSRPDTCLILARSAISRPSIVSPFRILPSPPVHPTGRTAQTRLWFEIGCSKLQFRIDGEWQPDGWSEHSHSGLVMPRRNLRMIMIDRVGGRDIGSHRIDELRLRLRDRLMEPLVRRRRRCRQSRGIAIGTFASQWPHVAAVLVSLPRRPASLAGRESLPAELLSLQGL
jgi:hypothetical protein